MHLQRLGWALAEWRKCALSGEWLFPVHSGSAPGRLDPYQIVERIQRATGQERLFHVARLHLARRRPAGDAQRAGDRRNGGSSGGNSVAAPCFGSTLSKMGRGQRRIGTQKMASAWNISWARWRVSLRRPKSPKVRQASL